jgi:hypothetical protein
VPIAGRPSRFYRAWAMRCISAADEWSGDMSAPRPTPVVSLHCHEPPLWAKTSREQAHKNPGASTVVNLVKYSVEYTTILINGFFN